MKSLKKRMLSGILALAMILGVFAGLPFTAVAEEAEGTEYKIGGTDDSSGFWYEDLDTLLEDKQLADGDTITLLGDTEYYPD